MHQMDFIDYKLFYHYHTQKSTALFTIISLFISIKPFSHI